jgi:phosphoadenosine phosphosulfate reductase
MLFDEIKAVYTHTASKRRPCLRHHPFSRIALCCFTCLAGSTKLFLFTFINTGYHFPETVRFRDQVSDLFGLNTLDLKSDIPKFMQRDSEGRLLFTSDPDHCCYLNKTQPVDAILLSHDV